MQATRIITFVILLLAVLFMVSAWRIGFFVQPEIIEQEIGPYFLIYQEITGHYQQFFPIVDRLRDDFLLYSDSVHVTGYFGFYLHNPELVRPDSMHWLAGIILDQLPDHVNDSLKIAVINRAHALVANIQGRSKTTFLIGPFVIYPKMEKFAHKNGYQKAPFALGQGIIEFYLGEPVKRITYVMPVTSQPVD